MHHNKVLIPDINLAHLEGLESIKKKCEKVKSKKKRCDFKILAKLLYAKTFFLLYTPFFSTSFVVIILPPYNNHATSITSYPQQSTSNNSAFMGIYHLIFHYLP